MPGEAGVLNGHGGYVRSMSLGSRYRGPLYQLRVANLLSPPKHQRSHRHVRSVLATLLAATFVGSAWAGPLDVCKGFWVIQTTEPWPDLNSRCEADKPFSEDPTPTNCGFYSGRVACPVMSGTGFAGDYFWRYGTSGLPGGNYSHEWGLAQCTSGNLPGSCPTGYVQSDDTGTSFRCVEELKGDKVDPGLTAGPSSCSANPGTQIGNPINFTSGNKYKAELDYRGAGAFPLVFERHYNSAIGQYASIPGKWRHTYQRRLNTTFDTHTYAEREDGKVIPFIPDGADWRSFEDQEYVLSYDAGADEWTLVTPNEITETYDG